MVNTNKITFNFINKFQILKLLWFLSAISFTSNISAQLFSPPTAELSGSTSICPGESASLTLKVSGFGSLEVVYTDGVNDFTIRNIIGNSHVFSVSPETSTIYELVSVKDAFGRTGQVSGSATVTVIPLPVGGIVTGGNSQILLTQTTGTLTLSGHTGTVSGWQKKINDGSWTNISHTQATYSETPSSAGIYLYRAVLQTVCGTAWSEPFQIEVINSPEIEDANYDASNGNFVIFGRHLNTDNEIEVTKLTISNGDNSYRFTNQAFNVFPSSPGLATIVFEGKEKAFLNWILNNNGLRSRGNTPYNLSFEENWNGSALADPSTPVAVSGFQPPSIESAIFDYGESTLEVTARRLAAAPEPIKDIDAGKFTITGKDNNSYTLTSASPDVDVHSETKFIIFIGDADKSMISQLIDVSGRTSSTGHPYNLAASDRWNRPVHKEYDISDLTGNEIEAQGIENQPPQALNVKISGVLEVCMLLTASYEYFDPEGDPEGETRITWYRADDDSGKNEEEIHQGPSYTLTLDDEQKSISVMITPVAATGTPEGAPVQSMYSGPVENTLPTVSITGPGELCEGSAVEIAFELTGTGPWTLYYTDGTNEYDFTATSTPYSLSISRGGNYSVTALIDGRGCEAAEPVNGFNIKPVPTVIIDDWYAEAFENGTSGWTSAVSPEGMVNSWTFGQPEGDVFTSASVGSNIWYTAIADLNIAEQSWVTSPCFDLTQTTRPMIALDLWAEFGRDHDGAVLQYSVNNDDRWLNAGDTGQGINWFNSSQIAGMPGGQETGWTATDNQPGENGWAGSRHDLDFLAGQENIRFRLAYGSDGSGLSEGGIAFDNIRIGERTKLVLLEHFTNANDQSSIEANQIIYDIARSKPDDFIFISYHTAFPSSDPINSQNTADPAARALYYGVSSVPFSIMDGGSGGEGEFDYSSLVPDENELMRRALTDPIFFIDISQNQKGSDLYIEIEVESVLSLGPLDLTLHVAILETNVPAELAGMEGDMIFRNVVRKLQPDAGGTILSKDWTPGIPENHNFNWTIRNVYNAENLAIVAFIQDENSREIYQIGYADEFGIPVSSELTAPEVPGINAGFHPNPVKGNLFIDFGKITNGDHILEIYNLSGKMISMEILRAGDSLYEIDAGTLPGGMHLFIIRNTRDIIGSARVVIMK
jgi:hypothetical protein